MYFRFMNFWKVIIALICGVGIWFYLDNPFKKEVNDFNNWKDYYVDNPDEVGDDWTGNLFRTLFGVKDTSLQEWAVRNKVNLTYSPKVKEEGVYDLYLSNCKSEQLEIGIIKSVLNIDETQAKILSESKNDTVPLLTGIKESAAKIYAKAFFDVGCISVLKETE